MTWCLEWATLSDRAGELVKNLSGGMKRRLNMAGGLIHQPRLVLMDEPTVGVDPQSRNHIFEMIEKLRGEGMSLIYTTHYMEEAERLCDRIAIVDHGKIIALGSRDELVRNAFGTRSQVLAHFGGPPDERRRVGGRARRADHQRHCAIHDRASGGDCEPAGGLRPRPGSNWWMYRCGSRISNRYFCN